MAYRVSTSVIHRIMDAGRTLLPPATEFKILPWRYSYSKLLGILAQIEQILSTVQQLPSESMKLKMHPIIEALIAEELVKHSHINVNIAVACCICEILRIMAPDSPYNDEQMKDFFEMTTMIFERLSLGRYAKMTKVLKTFSSFRLSVLMLDLPSDELIVRLFRRFLTVANSKSSSAVVLEMEKIMTMIIDESQPPNLKILGLLITSVKKENQISSPVCWKLGNKVLKNCAGQLKPHFRNIVNDLGISFQDYSEIVASICNGELETEAMVSPKKQDDINKLKKCASGKRKLECTEMKENHNNNHTPLKKLANETANFVEHGDNLVGSRIKVWLPEDEIYYEGVVDSFDHLTSSHKICYTDGHEEILNLKEERWKLVENVFALRDSVEHESPKISSLPKSGVICVHGYKVNQNIAPILEAIFTKHGDIAAKCVFKASSVRASFLEVVCKIARQIQTHKGKIVISQMEEIENEISNLEATNMNVSWLRAHLEGFYKKKEVETKKSSLMEIKENIISVKISAEIELKERYMEMLTAYRRFKKGEKCMKVLDIVEKNVNNNISECKSVEDSWMKTINFIG